LKVNFTKKSAHYTRVNTVRKDEHCAQAKHQEQMTQQVIQQLEHQQDMFANLQQQQNQQLQQLNQMQIALMQQQQQQSQALIVVLQEIAKSRIMHQSFEPLPLPLRHSILPVKYSEIPVLQGTNSE